MIKALIWNEWRRQRNMILLLAAGSVILWMLCWVSLTIKWLPQSSDIMNWCLVCLLLLYALLMGSAFASELESQIPSVLLSLPTSPSRIFWRLYAVNLGIVLALTVMNAALCPTTTQLLDYSTTPLLLLLLLSVHAIAVACSLLGRGLTYSIIGIPWLFIMLVFGVVLINIWIWEGKYGFGALVGWIFGVWMALLVLNRYLWIRRQATGRPVIKIKPALWALGCSLVLPVLLFLMSWGYAEIRLQYAVRQAIAAGLTTDPAMASPPIYPAPNAVPILAEFVNKIYESKHCFNDNLRNQIEAPSETVTPALQWRQKIFHRYAWLENTVVCHPLEDSLQRFLAYSSSIPLPSKATWATNFYSFDNYSLMIVNDYLIHQAMMAIFRGRDHEFFSRLEQLQQLAAFYLQPSYHYNLTWFSWTLWRMDRLAIILGPETLEAAAFYRKLLATVDRATIIGENYPWKGEMLIEFEMSQFGASLARPRVLLNSANNLRFDVEEEKLLRPLQPLAALRKFQTDRNLHISRNGHHSRVLGYLLDQKYADAYRLALALRIYHIEHGVWPETLSKLVPELLPEIPLDALTGKPFGYEREAGGFSISAEKEQKPCRSSIYIYYYPWRELAKQEAGK